MPDVQQQSHLPLSRLLDAIEERLEISKVNAAMAKEIDDAIERVPTMLRRMKGTKNYLAPINQLPSDIFAHVAAFLPKKRDLINATAVCKYWRTALLSFPLLWQNASGSPPEIQAYIERSGSAPLSVSIPCPSFANLLAPHTSRLVNLTVGLITPWMFREAVESLPHPIPTLHTLNIDFDPKLPESALEFPPDLTKPFFMYVKKLGLKGRVLLRGPQTFHNVTDLTLDMSQSKSIGRILEMFERFPILERVAVTLREDLYARFPPVVTLPYVQEMSISAPRDGEKPLYLPGILGYLQLPKLASLRVQVFQDMVPANPFFPYRAFHDHLPNFVELPELRVDIEFASPERSLSAVCHERS